MSRCGAAGGIPPHAISSAIVIAHTASFGTKDYAAAITAIRANATAAAAQS
jgi:hypothetical protein